MYQVLKTIALLAVVGCVIFVATPEPASAQVVVTTYAPAAPVVGFVPERRGLLGLQTVWRPVVSTPVAVPVTMVVPAAPVTVAHPVVVSQPVVVARPVVVASPVVVSHPVTTTLYAPAAPVTTTLYAPAAPVTTTLYAPAAPVTTTLYAPAAPVTTYAPVMSAGCGCAPAFP